jgi:xanthine dehydrogenase accessory factor
VSATITAAAAARAVLQVRAGGAPIAIVAAIEEGQAVRRMIVPLSGEATGTLGDAVLDATALRLAEQALRGGNAAATAAPDTARRGGGSAAATAEPGDANAPRRGGDPPVVHPLELGGRSWLLYVETHFPPDHLVIVGAGHIAVPLAGLALRIGFRVTVIDDREEFATEERFDDGVAVLRGNFAVDPFAGIGIDERTWVALVTRGHRWDFDCLRRLVGRGERPHYIGMIGSRRRVRAAFGALLEAGTPRPVLAMIHAPIGLEIGAETPEEIAVAIAAELIAVRRGAAADTISRRERVLDRLLGGADDG